MILARLTFLDATTTGRLPTKMVRAFFSVGVSEGGMYFDFLRGCFGEVFCKVSCSRLEGFHSDSDSDVELEPDPARDEMPLR